MRRHIATVFAAVLGIASTALAWNKPGHMIVAGIAYDVLQKDHPQTVKKVIDLLHHHPQWDKFSKIIDTVPEADRDRYLFMVAARWPDDVRSEPGGYSHATWHYVDFPIVFPADKGKVTPQPPGKENALTAIDAQTKVLKNGTDAERQAVAICWVMHLVGDLHQPLHCCSLYSAQNPKGDKGGNADIVRVDEGRATINLHSLWDGLMTSSTRYQTADRIGQELLERPEFAKAKLPGVNDPKPYDWAWESYNAAVHYAYLDGELRAGKDKKDKASAPILPEGYPQAARAVADKRIILAGYRLADQLQQDLR